MFETLRVGSAVVAFVMLVFHVPPTAKVIRRRAVVRY